jgi:hypothetical protein
LKKAAGVGRDALTELIRTFAEVGSKIPDRRRLILDELALTVPGTKSVFSSSQQELRMLFEFLSA